MRSTEMQFDIRLDRWHLVPQTALAWANSHLYGSEQNIGFGIPDPTWETVRWMPERQHFCRRSRMPEPNSSNFSMTSVTAVALHNDRTHRLGGPVPIPLVLLTPLVLARSQCRRARLRVRQRASLWVCVLTQLWPCTLRLAPQNSIKPVKTLKHKHNCKGHYDHHR